MLCAVGTLLIGSPSTYVHTQETEFSPNMVRTSKYKLYSFLPIFLWEEFNPTTKIANVYFIFIAVLQVSPVLPLPLALAFVLRFALRLGTGISLTPGQGLWWPIGSLVSREHNPTLSQLVAIPCSSRRTIPLTSHTSPTGTALPWALCTRRLFGSRVIMHHRSWNDSLSKRKISFDIGKIGPAYGSHDDYVALWI